MSHPPGGRASIQISDSTVRHFARMAIYAVAIGLGLATLQTCAVMWSWM